VLVQILKNSIGNAGDGTCITVTSQKTNTSLLNVKVYSHPLPKNGSQVRSNIKRKLVIFVESESIVYEKFFPPGHKVKQYQYGEVLQHLREEVCRNP
jgi:hypothetical protein